MKSFYITIFFLIAVVFSTNAQQTPAKKQSNAITIVGATAHIGNGTVIENSIIIFKDGKITACVDATTSKITHQGTTINAQGKHVYPGFIAVNSTLGLAEIDAVRATRDFRETGAMNPHIRSIIAYNTESKVVESMRPNGVLLGQITPRGGFISGTSSIVQFDAWNWEDAIVKEDDGIHINWPNAFSRGRWWMGEDSSLKPNKNYQKQIDQLANYINASKAHDNSKTHLPYQAMQGLFYGSKTLYVHANNEKAIVDAVYFSKENGIKRMVIVGGYYAYRVANVLKQNNIAVLLQRTHRVPNHDDDDYDLPFKLAKKLVDAGVLVGLENSGRMERMNTRNLPFYAGICAGYGLTKEQALQLITLNNAKILGIDKHYGTLEEGKSATLFISEGDALDMRTNILVHAFIDGREVSLETHQTKLWERYSNKYKTE